MNYEPLAIIGAGAFISVLIITYYSVKLLAKNQGLNEARKITIDERPPVAVPPQRSYTVTFKNGTEYKFGGVKMEVVTDEYDDNIIESLNFVPEGYEDLPEDEYEAMYDRSQLFIDKTEILTIVETRTPKYSI